MTTRRLLDDLGASVALAEPPRRIVSLVPSITESLASSVADRLVGVTDWCTHPQDLDDLGVTRVRGTKNPDLARIAGLRPDLVVANMEENRELDVRRLREGGIPVWVTRIEDVPTAFASLRRLFADVLQVTEPDWLTQAARLWSGELSTQEATVAVAIWRDPWMVVGRDTFTGDLLRRAGLANAFAAHKDRYPHITLDQLDDPAFDAVLLPDEPYVFTAADGPAAFAAVPTHLVSGRELTWYGPSLIQAHGSLTALRERLTAQRRG